jgi:hypothetical protein
MSFSIPADGKCHDPVPGGETVGPMTQAVDGAADLHPRHERPPGRVAGHATPGKDIDEVQSRVLDPDCHLTRPGGRLVSFDEPDNFRTARLDDSLALTGCSDPIATGAPTAVQLTKRSTPRRLHRPALDADEPTGVEASLPSMFRLMFRRSQDGPALAERAYRNQAEPELPAVRHRPHHPPHPGLRAADRGPGPWLCGVGTRTRAGVRRGRRRPVELLAWSIAPSSAGQTRANSRDVRGRAGPRAVSTRSLAAPWWETPPAAAAVYPVGAGADGSFCHRPNSFPWGSLQVANQPMPGTEPGSFASPPSSLTRAAPALMSSTSK